MPIMFTKQKRPRIAKDDIQVYKVIDLEKRPPYDGYYRYRYGTNLPQRRKPYVANTGPGALRVVMDGYLVVYRTLEPALDFAAANSDYPLQYRVIEMRVPQGAKCYDGDDKNKMAASMLIWDEGAAVHTPESGAWDNPTSKFRISRDASVKETREQ